MMKTLQTKHGLIPLEVWKKETFSYFNNCNSLLEDLIYILLTFYVLMQKKMLEILIPTKSF